MESAQELIKKIRSYQPDFNENLVQKAFIFAKTAHGNQKRHSGDPYFSHPLAVAEIITNLKLDQDSIIAALLHDVVEDTDITLEEIEKEFGEDVAKIVDGVTKLGKIESIPANQAVAENFRKLAIAMSDDIRVLLVKLADRMHNMRTLHYVPSREKRIKKARESLEIYAPLAGRMGLNMVKDELQELAFEIIEPEARKQIVDGLNDLREKRRDLIDKILEDLNFLLKEEKIKFEISGREKKPYSIWEKMKSYNSGFHNLHDIMAFRIITEDISECYRVLGIINSTYNMIPQTFKDYISTPKENGYQSLHLAILGPFNKKIEIQIRDKKMHEIAELGVAAHWRYKEKFQGNKDKETEQYRWIRELVSLFENSEKPTDVLKHHKFQVYQDEVFCFTPNGDIFNLVAGSTVVDFAYAVHSQVGNNCVSAKVNGIICPLRQKLENGDQVEIITSKNAKPSPNWLQFVVSAKARSAIKAFIRNEKFSEYQNLGRAILNKFFISKDLELSDKLVEKILPNFHQKSVANLYVKVAEGIFSRQEILKAVYPEYKEEAKPLKTSVKNQEKKRKNNYSLPIEGLVNGMALHYAGCCNPIPGDPIAGVINTGSGVTIHNQNCRNLKNLALVPQRILDVCWKENDEFENEEVYISKIRLLVENKSGLADITNIIAKKKVNIANLKIIGRSSDYFDLIIDIEVKNLEHLEEIISALRISKKVAEVERIAG